MEGSQKSRENYLRVTQVLYPYSGLQNINPTILANAARRGTKVHKICEGIVAGLGEIGVDDETRPYVESFKQWWGEGYPIHSLERRFWCDELKITGQVDYIIQTSDGLAIVDIKTSYKPSFTWPVQGSAYYYLAKKNNIDVKKIYFLHLSREGKRAKVYEYPPNESFFFEVLNVYNYFFNPGNR